MTMTGIKSNSVFCKLMLGVSTIAMLSAAPNALAQEQDSLRILSFNTWGKLQPNAGSLELYSRGNYDIITIQEYKNSYGEKLQEELNKGANQYWRHADGDKGLLSRLDGITGVGDNNNPYILIKAKGSRPATIVSSEHLNHFDSAFDKRIEQALKLNSWAQKQTSPIILIGDFNAGDVAERGLLNIEQQELIMKRAKSPGNSNYKLWALQYVARNHPIGSVKYQAAADYIDGKVSTMPEGLFSDETYPVEGNTPYTMNVLKKEYQILQNPEDKEPFAPHKKANGSVTWPSVLDDEEATRWPAWGRTQIDHFVVSRPYAKWWALADKADDPYSGGVLDQSVSTHEGKALSDHEPVAHDFIWLGPKVNTLPDGNVQLLFDKNISGATQGEFQLSRNNNRSDVYIGQISDASGRPIFSRPLPVADDYLAKLLAQSVYDRSSAEELSAERERLKSFVLAEQHEAYQKQLDRLSAIKGGEGAFREVIKAYFNGHRSEFPGINDISDMSWEQWGRILLKDISSSVKFQNVPTSAQWDALRTALDLDNPKTRAMLKQATGLDFDNDPYAPLKLQLACRDPKMLKLKGARDLCIDNHERFKDIIVEDGLTLAIDESEALGSPLGTLTLNNSGLRTAGTEDAWAAWADPINAIDKKILLQGMGGWIEISNPDVAVTALQEISGKGALAKKGKGTLELAAINRYTGGTYVEDGTLKSGVAGGFVDNTAYSVNGGTLDLNGFDLTASRLSGKGGSIELGKAKLNIQQADDTLYNGNITGTGSLTKTGAGRLVLNGKSNYSGPTQIKEGSVIVGDRDHPEASLASAVTVYRGALLGGIGTLGGLNIESGGILSPGNSIGTLNINGNLTMDRESIYNVELPGKGAGDLIKVSGTAKIKGGDVHVTALDSKTSYQNGKDYTILTAEGGVDGTFAKALSQSAFLDVNLLHSKKDVKLKVDIKGAAKRDSENRVIKPDPEPRKVFTTTANTYNQNRTAEALDTLVQSGTSLALYNKLLILNEGDSRIAYDSLSGEIYASLKSALISDSHFTRDAVNERIRSAFGSTGTASTPVFSYGPNGLQSVPSDTDQLAVWGKAYGAWGNSDGTYGSAKLEHDTRGMFIGADAAFDDVWRVGVLAGYGGSSFNVDGRSSFSNIDNYTIAAYAGAKVKDFSLRFGVGHNWHNIDASRQVGFTGFADQVSSSYAARSVQLFGEASYTFHAGKTSFEPFAGIAHVNLRTEGYDENGIAGLHSGSETSAVTYTTLGLRASTAVQFDSITGSLNGMLGWQHAFGNTAPFATHSFNGSKSFSIAGNLIDEDTALMEAGFDWNINDATKFGVSYQGQIGRHSQQHGFNAKLRVAF